MHKPTVNRHLAKLKGFTSSVWAMMEYGSYPLLMFIATPWFLRQLGTAGYGYWMLLTATTGFGGVLNTGTGAATIKAVSAGIGRAERRDIEQAIRVSLALAILGGGALALLVFCLFWFAGPALFSRMGDPSLIRLTGVVAAALLLIEQVDNVLSSGMKGAEEFGQAAQVEIATKATQIIAAGLALCIWPTLYALYASLFITTVLRFIAKTLIARRILRLTNLRPTLDGAREILHFAKWGWLQGIGGMLFGVSDRMLVGSLLGASSLTFYSIATQLAMQTHAVSAAGLSVIFPKISRKLQGTGSFSLWRVTKLTMSVNLLMSSALALMLILLGPLILRAWIGAESAASTMRILPWLVIAYWVLALNAVPYYILLGMGQMRFVGLTTMSSGIIAVVTMYFAIAHIGLAGAPAGRLIYALLSLALAFPLARHFLRENHVRRTSKRSDVRRERTAIVDEYSNLSCPHCASNELRTLGKLPDSHWFAGKHIEKPLSGGTLYRCRRCQLKFRFPVHDIVTYLQLYDNAAVSAWPENTARPDWDLIISHILQRLPQGGRILDFGCYTGGLLARLGSTYERHGVEINKAAAALASDKRLAHVWQSIDDIPGDLCFNVVIASDVIEHIENPGHLIDMLVTLLSDDGILIITTGDAENNLWNRFRANWWYCFYPEHISFISRAWLDHFSHTRGLSIEHCDRFRYLRLSTGRRLATSILTYFYGYFPTLYLGLHNILRNLLRRPTITSVPGNGVSADHLFIVLLRNGKSP